MGKKGIEIELVNSVASANITNLSCDILELSLDSFLESGLLKDIPFFGSFVKIYGAQKEIRSQLFLKKVAHFLFALKDTDEEERKRFIAEMNFSKEKKREFGEAVILLIEKAEDMTKPYLIGRIIKAFIESKLEYIKAMRLCKMIDRAYTQDLLYLKNFKNGIQREHDIAASLFSCGFLSFGGMSGGNAAGTGGGIMYNLNEYGKIFLTYGLTGQ